MASVTLGNFLKSFRNYYSGFVKTYGEGLFALVVALLTFGLERLLDKEVFNCPKTGYQGYAMAFFFCPIVMLTLLNLLTIPAEGGFYIWSLFETCWVMPYRRRGDFFSGFLSAICVGLIAPIAWIFLALLDARHLVCWELGYHFGDNVTDSYLKDRGFSYFTVEQYNDKVHDAESRANTVAVTFLGVSVVIICIVVIIRRSCLKPFELEQRLPGLCLFEQKEAFAARDEVERLLTQGDEFDEFSSTASMLQFLVIKERILSLEKEKEHLEPISEKVHEINLEIAEFKRLERVLHFWAEWHKFNMKKELNMLADDMEDELADAKAIYEGQRDKLLESRKTRAEAAKKILEKYESNVEGEVPSSEVSEAIYQSWLLARLEQQDKFFNVEDIMKRWEKAKDGVKMLKQSLDSQLYNGFIESPEVRGRIVASYLIKLFKEQNDYCQTLEQLLDKFASIYPRVATSNPHMRYVDVQNPMYKYIIDDDNGKTKSGENIRVPLLYTCVKPWKKEHDEEWKQSMRYKHHHSWFWRIRGCKNSHCPNCPRNSTSQGKTPSIEDVEAGSSMLLTNYNNSH